MTTQVHKALFSLLRRLSDGRFHSGQNLALEFQLSRASIFNLMNQAESMGLKVHAVRGRGYKLPVPVDWLDEAAIVALLADVANEYDIRIQDSVASTNLALMVDALEGAVDGSVLCVEHQTAGKGRRGRKIGRASCRERV